MKINSSEPTYSLVVFDSAHRPYSFKMNKKFLRNLFILLPSFFLLLIFLFAGITFYYKLLLTRQVKKTPLEFQALQKKNISMTKNIIELEKENKSLVSRLSQGATSQGTSSQLTGLEFFQVPTASSNLNNKELCLLDEMKTTLTGNEVKISFNLKNNNDGDKLSGYVHVLLYTKEGIQFYPIQETDSFEFLRYNSGESFTVSRFRPVNAVFTLNKNIQKYWFRVILFSREGDIILSSKTTDYFKK